MARRRTMRKCLRPISANQGIEPGDELNKLEMISNRPTPDPGRRNARGADSRAAYGESRIGHGSVLIAAITSCTNTSNPSVMLAAGLLAKKAVERGLTIDPAVKTSLAPGSRVVSDYLTKPGCKHISTSSASTSSVTVAPPASAILVHSTRGSRKRSTNTISSPPPFFPAIATSRRASIKTSRPTSSCRRHSWSPLPSPAGSISIWPQTRSAKDREGRDVYLKDLWPSLGEIRNVMQSALTPEVFRKLYRDFADQNPKWNEIPSSTGEIYQWDETSDYIHEPPFFADFSMAAGKIEDIREARSLGIFGDSVTTDHISPAGAIKAKSPAGQYLVSRGIEPEDFNSYGSRRGNDLVMTRGTFANVRIKNLMVPGTEGGVTIHQPSGGANVHLRCGDEVSRKRRRRS